MPLMRWVANIIYFIVGLLYLPIAMYQAVCLGKNRRGWRHRFGFVPRFPPGCSRIWIHAVSLGEMNATTQLVSQIKEHLPDVDLIFSTTTDTGYTRAVKLYGMERVFRFPLDFSPVIARALRRIQPTMIVLVEQEVWHNLVRMATAQHIPVAVVNGRLTKRSARRLAWLGGAARAMFADLAWVGAQDEAIAERFRKLGVAADRVTVTSSLKWDSAEVADSVEGADELAYVLGLDRHRPVWVCGSTGPGEEAIILQAYRDVLDACASAPPASAFHDARAVQLIIVPRKPERFDEVARLITREGFRCIRRGEHNEHHPAQRVSAPTVFLGDSMGELRKFYALADVVFVGRSLVPMGGSDPMEVAALGRPILVGPHMENFAAPTEALTDADAVEVVSDAATLTNAVMRLAADTTTAQRRGAAGRATVIAHQGATKKTVDMLSKLGTVTYFETRDRNKTGDCP